jgi:hypothetical protein
MPLGFELRASYLLCRHSYCLSDSTSPKLFFLICVLMTLWWTCWTIHLRCMQHSEGLFKRQFLVGRGGAHSYSNVLRRLRQEDCLRPRVWDQTGQYSLKRKIKNFNHSSTWARVCILCHFRHFTCSSIFGCVRKWFWCETHYTGNWNLDSNMRSCTDALVMLHWVTNSSSLKIK